MIRTIPAFTFLLACSSPPATTEQPATSATQQLSHPVTQPSATQQLSHPATQPSATQKPSNSATPQFDIVITNGLLIDGTGAPRRRADVAINGDTIAAIGDLSHATAKVTLDAHGDVVTPGFIDLLGHSEGSV